MADETNAAPVDATPAPASPAPVPVDAAPTGLRFKAPVDTTGITLSTGRFLAVGDNGVLSVPDDLNRAELDGLATQGFTAL